jgi:hypothetical protein
MSIFVFLLFLYFLILIFVPLKLFVFFWKNKIEGYTENQHHVYQLERNKTGVGPWKKNSQMFPAQIKIMDEDK